MDLSEYKAKYGNSDAAPGWEAIDDALSRIYRDQTPKHFAPQVSASIGGEDPLDGISLYQAKSAGVDYFHIVSYGFSQLFYDEEAFGGPFSKFGFELTFRPKLHEDDEEYPFWAVNLIRNIAKYVFSSGNWFEPNHYMPANGPLRLNTDTDLVGLVFFHDPELGVIQTVHGEVQFLQMFGVTQTELENISQGELKIPDLISSERERNPLLITDLSRKPA